MPGRPVFYVTGGSLRADAPSYVVRRADTDLISNLQRGELCHVLTPRQMGKSSLKVRTAAKLRAESCRVAAIDLTSLGRNLQPEQWYFGLLMALGEQIGDEVGMERLWTEGASLGPLPRFLRALRSAAARAAPACRPGLVVFIDEIDMVRSLPFPTDELFAAIREQYDRRAHDAEASLLTFCLLGAAAPNELVRDHRITPFNVGARIELSDFTSDEASPLVGGLCSDNESCRARRNASDKDVQRCARETLDRVMHWTGGHPYLTQRLCHAVATSSGPCGPGAVDRVCAETFFDGGAPEEDPNLAFVRSRLLHSDTEPAGLLSLYDDVRSGRRVEDEARDPLVAALHLSGIVRSESGHLCVRNRIYRRVFDHRWVQMSMPGVELARIRSAYRRGVRRTTGVAAAFGLFLTAWALSSAYLTAQSEHHRVQAERRRAEAGSLADRLGRTAAERQAALDRLRGAVQTERQARAAATKAEQRANVAAADAETRGHEARRRLRQLVIAAGSAALDHGDVSLALLWCTECLRLDANGPLQQSSRLRVGTILALYPELVRMLPGARSIDSDEAGSRCATAHADGCARVWDAVTGAMLGQAMRHSGGLDRALLSPDGSLVATIGGGNIHVWRVGARAPDRIIAVGSPVQDAVWFPASDRIAAHSRAGLVCVWSARSGRVVGQRTEVYPGPGIVRVSADGRLLAASSASGEAVVIDSQTGLRISETPVIGEIADIAFSPDGALMAVASKNFYNAEGGNAGVTAWSTRDGKPAGGLFPHEGGARSVTFDRVGRRIFSVGADRMLQTWDLADVRTARPGIDLGSPGLRIAVDRSGGLLVAAARSTGVRLWDATRSAPRSPWFAAANGARDARLLKDSRVLLVLDSAQTAYIWRLAPRARHNVWLGSNASCLSPDGKTVLVGSKSGRSAIVASGTGRRLADLRHEGEVAEVAYSPDGRYVAATGYDGYVHVWDARSGRCIADMRHGGEGRQVQFTADSGRLVVTTSEGVCVYRLDKPRLVRRVAVTGTDVAAAVDRDASILAIDDARGIVRTFALATGEPLGTGRGPTGVSALEMASTGGRLLVAGGDGVVMVLDPRTCRRIGPILRHMYPVRHACWSPDGRAIAVATGEQDAQGPRSGHVWDARSGRPLIPPLTHHGAVRHISYSPDGTLIVTGSADRTLRVWDAASGEPISQPIDMPGQVYYAQIARDNRTVLAACNDGSVEICRLQAATDTPANLLALAQLLSGRRIDVAGGVAPLLPAEREALARATGPESRNGSVYRAPRRETRR